MVFVLVVGLMRIPPLNKRSTWMYQQYADSRAPSMTLITTSRSTTTTATTSATVLVLGAKEQRPHPKGNTQGRDGASFVLVPAALRVLLLGRRRLLRSRFLVFRQVPRVLLRLRRPLMLLLLLLRRQRNRRATPPLATRSLTRKRGLYLYRYLRH